MLVFLILMIGGITRQAGAGLSMSEWELLPGLFPSISEAQWESAHRLLRWLMAPVLMIPFVWFLVRKKIDRRQTMRATVLLIVGAAHVLLSWFLAQNVLSDDPIAGPYRLALELSVIYLLFGLCVWFALDLRPNQKRPGDGASEFRKWGLAIFGLFVLQVIWGAFVTGHHAGHIYNTFPMMNQFWVPPEIFIMEPLLSNFTQNMSMVQWLHRLLGTLLLLAVVGLWVRMLIRKPGQQALRLGLALLALVLLQYAVGVFALIWHVPISLAVMHQVLALILFGVLTALFHHLQPIGRRPYALSG